MIKRTILNRAGLARYCGGAIIASAMLLAPLGGCGSNAASGGISATTGGATVATVGGEAVGRNELDSYLETAYGESALQQLIDYKLVQQKLKASGLEVTDDEVNKAIADRAKRDLMYAAAIKTEGPRKEALVRNARNELAINKLLTKDIKVTDAELKVWFDKNHTRYDQPARVKMGIIAASTKVRADTMAQQLKSKTKTFKELVDEQKKALDPQAKNGSTEETPEVPIVGFEKTPPLRDAVAKLKVGDISPVLSLGTAPNSVYIIVRLVDRQDAKKADLTLIKPQVEMDYKMEKVMAPALASMPANAGAQAAQYQQQYMQQVVGQMMDGIKRDAAKSGGIQVTDPAFEQVAKTYAQAAAAPATMPGSAGSMAPGGPVPSGAPMTAPAGGVPKTSKP